MNTASTIALSLLLGAGLWGCGNNSDDPEEARPPGSCTAAPSCSEGQEPFDTEADCLETTNECTEVEVCDSTIWCGGEETSCDAAPPVCDPATEREYGSEADCLDSATECVEQGNCAGSVWCGTGFVDAGASDDDAGAADHEG